MLRVTSTICSVSAMGGGAAIAPPKSLLEEDEVVQPEMLQEPGECMERAMEHSVQ